MEQCGIIGYGMKKDGTFEITLNYETDDGYTSMSDWLAKDEYARQTIERWIGEELNKQTLHIINQAMLPDHPNRRSGEQFLWEGTAGTEEPDFIIFGQYDDVYLLPMGLEMVTVDEDRELDPKDVQNDLVEIVDSLKTILEGSTETMLGDDDIDLLEI